MDRRAVFLLVPLALAFAGCSSDPVPARDGGSDLGASDAPPVTDASVTDSTADGSAEAVLVPQIDGDWWTVAHTPDVGMFNAAGQQPVDFAVWRAPDGTWQLWSCIRYIACAGHQRLLYHWEGADITATDWHPAGIAMQSDPSVGEPACGLQAPYVIQANGRFHMFYGDWDHICQSDGTDGKTFTRELDSSGQSGMFYEASLDANTRDPMVLRIGDTYYLYYTAHPGGHGSVYVRTSQDLRTWSASRRVASGGAAGDGPYAAECPHVVYRPDTGYYYLFRTQVYVGAQQTTVYRSRDPMDFGIDDDRYRVETLPVAAPEIVTVDGQTWIAALLPGLDGIRIARLRWAPAARTPPQP